MPFNENDNVESEEVLKLVQKLRRVMMLSLSCIKNVAYYRARVGGQLPDFWQTCANNNIDMCVLDWYKLFADKKGKHFWKKVIKDQGDFVEKMLEELGINEIQFEEYAEQVKTYRDKYVAHADDKSTMHIPFLDLIKDSALFLCRYLYDHEQVGGCFYDAPPDFALFYSERLNHAESVYSRLD